VAAGLLEEIDCGRHVQSRAVSVQVESVRSRADLRAFINLPFRLHANGTPWIPPLRLERWAFLTKRFNPFFKHGEAELFLARRDGRVVGRISAQVDRAFNDYQQNRWGMFGFLELEDDPEAMRALLDAGSAWLRGQECDKAVGPMDFTMNDECGVLVEGYERPPMIRQSWHPPYYRELCEGAGLEKVVDLYMWELHISGRDRVLPVIWELAEKLGPEHGIRLRRMRRRSLRKDLDVFAEIYNEAWSRNWGFVPYTKADLDAYAMDLHLVFDPDWFMVAEREDGEPVGVAITIPDVNQVLKRMNGRLLPLGWLHYLRRRRIIDGCRVGFLGVKRDYQHTGVAAALYAEHFETSERSRVKWGEMGWILETNTPMNRAMEGMGGKIVKRYRIYERAL
jgi:GNAT superfamily N-acetyltransferase